jgi:membrane-associated phospholipid phosphatase
LFAGALTFAVRPASAAAPPPWTSHLFAAQRFDQLALDDSAPPAPDDAAPAKRPCPCKDDATRALKGKCFPQLVVHDAGRVFSAPARWRAKQWGIFTAEVLGVGFIAIFDDELRTAVRRGDNSFENDVAKIFEPLGTWGSFLVLGGFYAGGAAVGDDKARGVALDGLSATIIASGIVTPALKFIIGRSRPNAEMGPYDFHPFHGGASFPSGHVTQAFAVASVIATEYKQPWVQAVCYVPATLVGFARMRHDAHWASDVAGGALIGFGVGRAVALLNLPARRGEKHVRVMPVLAPGVKGAAVAATF